MYWKKWQHLKGMTKHIDKQFIFVGIRSSKAYWDSWMSEAPLWVSSFHYSYKRTSVFTSNVEWVVQFICFYWLFFVSGEFRVCGGFFRASGSRHYSKNRLQVHGIFTKSTWLSSTLLLLLVLLSATLQTLHFSLLFASWSMIE